jgi:hypothetical protein
VIKGPLRSQNDTPFRRPTPGRPIRCLGVGHLQGVSGVVHNQVWFIISFLTRPVRRGVSKGEEDSRRPPCVWAFVLALRSAVWGVARLQGVCGLGMAVPGETLGSPWIPLPVRACFWHCPPDHVIYLLEGFSK